MLLEQEIVENEVIEGWLTEEYDYHPPRRGQIRTGIIVSENDQGLIIDIGLKRDGLVPWSDVGRLNEEFATSLTPGREIEAQIVRPEDPNGNLILSLAQVQEKEDWQRAQNLLESGEIWTGPVTSYNKGGLLVDFGHIQGFVPASHLSGRSRPEDLSPSADHKTMLKAYLDQTLPMKVIEVDRHNRRLILSERQAQTVLSEQAMQRLLDELQKGQIVHGTVSQLCNFGAFVDLGGAEGLIHISELAWQRVRKPGDVLTVGEEIDVYVLDVDQKRQRISLSLKQAQPGPWDEIDEKFQADQLVLGTITNVVDFGAFAVLDEGVEGLIHESELGPLPPKETVQRGEEIVLRVLYVDASRQRIGLSLTRVSDEERAAFLAGLHGEPAQSEEVTSSDQQEPTPPVGTVDEAYWESLVEKQTHEPPVSVE